MAVAGRAPGWRKPVLWAAPWETEELLVVAGRPEGRQWRWTRACGGGDPQERWRQAPRGRGRQAPGAVAASLGEAAAASLGGSELQTAQEGPQRAAPAVAVAPAGGAGGAPSSGGSVQASTEACVC